MKVLGKILVTLFMIQLVNVNVARGDEVRLKNGDCIRGKVIRMEERKLIFTTSYAGELSILWDAISNLISDDPVNVMLTDETILKGFTKPSEDGTMKLKMGKIIETVSFDLAEIKSINPKPKTEEPHLKIKGRVNIGGVKKKANTDRKDYYFDAELVARTKKNRYTLGGEFHRAEDESKRSDDNLRGYMKYDHFMNHKWYLSNDASFEKNELKDLRWRSTLGAGLGYQFWETDLLNLSLESGVGYISEDYYEEDDNNYTSGRWVLKFDKFFFTKAVQFFHFHEGFIDFNDTSDLYIRSRTGFRFPIYKIFNATLQYNYDWDNSPSPGQDKADETSLFTLGCQW